MATEIQYRRGSGSQNDAFTGALGEITVDTTQKTLRVHDGSTAGGMPLVSSTYTGNVTITGSITASSFVGVDSTAISNGTVSAQQSNIKVYEYGNAAISIYGEPNVAVVSNLGIHLAAGKYFYGQSTSAQYADLAEVYRTDQEYEPGTVVVFGGTAEVTESHAPHDRRVAGVISTAPAYQMNADAEGQPIALTGRVPCKVRGPVGPGDLVVTSNLPGTAQKLDDDQYKPGMVLGKALQGIEDDQVHTIEVVVGRL